MQSNTQRWLSEFRPFVEVLSEQELKERLTRAGVTTQDPRGWLNRKLDKLRGLEQELRPVEWLAQCVWCEAGKTDLPFDFDDLYGMVGPSDNVVFGPFGPDEGPSLQVRPKLDELFSRNLDANEVQDELCALTDPPNIRGNRLSSAIELVLASCFSFAKTHVHGLDPLETLRLGPLDRHRQLCTRSTPMRRRRRRSHVPVSHEPALGSQ